MDSPESLLEHTTWLRRLAAGLVGDRALADDIVQDTFVAALRRPPAEDRPLRPWLARVVRNAARFRWRSDAHRTARETVAMRDAEAATPTSEELLARHQLQQVLAKLVGELAEPYRATILLRYAEGLEPAQIARKLGIPAGTVRWRISEGLERVRRGLDAEHGGDRKAWLLALAPLALWPRASHAAPIVPIAIAAVVAVAVVAGFALSHRATRGGVIGGSRHDVFAATLREVHAVTVASALVQPGAPSRRVTGRVVRDGAPVAGALVRLVADDSEPIELRSDAHGRFDAGVQAARDVSLGAAMPDALAAIRHVDLRDPTAATDVELELVACSARIAGRVSDANGTPIAHAQVLREDVIGTETDAHGAYELCALPTAALVAQLDLVVRADGYGALATRVAPADRSRRDFVLAPDATITGTAVANAAIWIEPDRDAPSPTGERAARQATVARADGRFRITGASGGRYRLGGAARGVVVTPMLVSVDAGGTADVTVRIVPAATIHGRVVMHGAPVSGARVTVRSGKSNVVERHDDPARDVVAVDHAVTQTDGSFVLDGVPAGATSFTAEPVRVTTPERELAAGDNTVVLEGEPLGRIRGVVRRHGVSVPFARIDMNGPSQRGITTDGTGRFELAGLEPGKYSFYADDQHRGAIGEAYVTLRDGETLDHDIELAYGAKITGTVVDASGAPVPEVSVRFLYTSGEQCRSTTDTNGAFACGSLVGGRTYTPEVVANDDATRPFPFVAPAAAIELGEDAEVTGVRLAIDPHTTALAGTVMDDTGAPAVDVRVSARGAGITHLAWVQAPTVTTDTAGHFRFDHLAPGEYELTATTLHDNRSAQRVAAAGTSDAVLALAAPTCAAPPQVEPAQRPTAPIVWDDRIELVGWDLPATARVGVQFDVTLVFRVRAPVLHAWNVFAHFDSSAHRNNADHEPAGEACPTSTWRTGDVLVDRFPVTLTFAENFTLAVGFYRPSKGDGPWENLAGPGGVTGVELGKVSAAP
jgi:RNA polymerase sigma factor (sigma-70 family)